MSILIGYTHDIVYRHIIVYFPNSSIVFQTKELLLGKIDVNIILLSLNRSFSRHVFSSWQSLSKLSSTHLA